MNEDPVNREQREFIWSATHGAVDAQLRRARTLDVRAFQTLGAGSALLGLAVLAVTLFSGPWPSLGLLLASAAAYALSLLFALLTVNTRRFRLGDRSDERRLMHGELTPAETRRALSADAAEAYQHNRRELARKTRYLYAALAALTTEAALLLASLLAALNSATG